MSTDFSNTIFSDIVLLYPNRGNTSSYVELGGVEEATYESVQDFVDQRIDLYSDLTSSLYYPFRPPGKGPINILFEFRDKLYVARDSDDGVGSRLYTTTDLEDLAKKVEWEEVDLGYEVTFTDGSSISYTVYDRDFLDTVDSVLDPKLDLMGSETSSISISNSGSSIAEGQWRTPEGVLEESESGNAKASRTIDQVEDIWHSTDALSVTGFDVGSERPSTASVVGVKAEIKYKFGTSVQQDLDKVQARMSKVTLNNTQGSDNKAVTTVRSADTEFDTYYTATIGGNTDTWSAGNLSTNRVYDTSFGINLAFEFQSASGGNLGAIRYSSWVHVAYVKLSVYLENGTERVYFWDGSSDVAEADLVHQFKREGEWDIETASGVLSITDVTNPSSIINSTEIRSASNGAGALLGIVDAIKETRLPSSSNMQANKSFQSIIKANFYIDEDKQAIYGCTGAGPAFRFDGKYFSHLRVPVPEDKDKPRHVSHHAGHLALGYRSGSVVVSVAGDPGNFEGRQGASEWGTGDIITGLIPLKGNALGIFCESSTYALVGNSIDTFTRQTISHTSGAVEYSAVDIGQPIFTDYSGVSMINSTDQYGDFNSSKLSFLLGPFIEGRIQDVCGICANVRDIVAAIKVRRSGQYKLYFNDGLILTMTFSEANENMPMFTWQNYSYDKSQEADTINRRYVPSAISSTVLSSGKELIAMGTDSGDVYILNEGTGIMESGSVYEYDSYLEFNPFNANAPITNLKYSEVFVHGMYSGFVELTGSAGVNYLEPIPDTTTDTVSMGDLLGPVSLGKIPGKSTFHLPSVTTGYSLRIDSVADGNLPHTIQALTYKVAPTSVRNMAPRSIP